ncbi:hypothetical protein [Gemmatimonas sp.]|jgi:hypothetical protein|uniref:hypothetical protein n=1 Tax=Gemmatimonas sp. TaxID=1962908 RepID=UPI0027B9204D|nr:hypothetical protein [Gemmatimonas sp.]
MLLRHTASALALAASLTLTSATAPLPAVAHGAHPAPTAATDVGGSSNAITCLGCVAAGVVTLASGGWVGVWTMFMVGGATAVAAGGTIATCTAACVAYLAED